jgi:hypothetical protein
MSAGRYNSKAGGLGRSFRHRGSAPAVVGKHPFGAMKARMAGTRFLMKTLLPALQLYGIFMRGR